MRFTKTPLNILLALMMVSPLTAHAATAQINTAPIITNTPPSSVTVGDFYSYTVKAFDAEGDTLSYKIQNRPSWLWWKDGWLRGYPGEGDAGTVKDITIIVSDGSNSTTIGPFDISVDQVIKNNAPTLSGNPESSITVGQEFSFSPTAYDTDGDKLSFTAQNVPGWLAFNALDGSLSGTPTSNDVGVDRNIVITVYDGIDSASIGPFSIETVNTAPTLLGNPESSITVGQEFSFSPTAFDADGDKLSFTAQNVPGWLAFNALDGSLSGTPTGIDVGTNENIFITVSDGNDSATIGPFSVVVNDLVLSKPQTTRKFNPGHYIDLLKWMTTSNRAETYITDVMQSGVTGIQVRYYWRDLEPTLGVYDFTRIEHALALVSSQGLRLIVLPEDKSFKDEMPVPDYLASYAIANNPGGYTVNRWDPYVIDRWVALMEALGERFDSHPNFEAISMSESAPGIPNDVLTANGYTPELYRDALIETIQRTAEALPTSRFFWYMNFLPMRQDYIAQVATAVAPYGVVMGGPDILPDDEALTNLTYPFYDQFKDTMPLFNSAMPDSYKHFKPDGVTLYTMQEIFEFGRDELHLDYVLWTYVPNSDTNNDTQDAYAVIANNPTVNLNP